MRSKVRTRGTPAPPPSTSRASGIILAVVLLAVGAATALTAEQLVRAAPGATPSPSASASDVAAASGTSPSPSESGSPSASPSPPAPILEAEMPHSVNGTTLTVQSATDATSLGRGPNYRAVNAAVTNLGKKASDLELAEAFDASGSLQMSVLGFRLAGVEPARLRQVIFDVWLATKTPGVTTTNMTLSGTPTTKVSYADGGPDEYVFVRGDSVFIVEAADQVLAGNIVGAMPKAGASPAASPAASASASSTASHTASPSAS